MILNLNRTEDQDLIGVFYGLVHPRPSILVQSAVDSYRLGLPFPEPMINTRVTVPKDAKRQYYITLTPEQTAFLKTYKPRQRTTVLRTLLRRVLWSYCLLFLEEDRSTEPKTVVETPRPSQPIPGMVLKAPKKEKPKPAPVRTEEPEPVPKAPELPKKEESLEDMSLDLFNNIIGGF